MINNIVDLRNHALRTLEKLENEEINSIEAAATAKLCDNVLSTIKIQIEHAKLLNKEPIIPFMGDLSNNKNLINHSKEKNNLLT